MGGGEGQNRVVSGRLRKMFELRKKNPTYFFCGNNSQCGAPVVCSLTTRKIYNMNSTVGYTKINQTSFFVA